MKELEIVHINMGDQAVVRDVFTRYHQPLCYYAGRILGEHGIAAQDIVQEAFIAIWNKKLVYTNTHSLKAYLYYSVYHACLDTIKSSGIHKRHHDRIRERDLRQHAEGTHAVDEQVEAETLAEVFRAIEQLPDSCRRIFKMSYLDGMSVEQVAAQLDISVNTVKTQRLRGRAILKRLLKNLPAAALLLFIS